MRPASEEPVAPADPTVSESLRNARRAARWRFVLHGGAGESVRQDSAPPDLASDAAATRRARLALAALCVALFCFNLFVPRDLWVLDEARYGEVVREMLAGGGWLVPRLNGFPYPDKPPLYFWIVAAVGAVIGHGELAFRLVSVASTLAAVAGVYQLGRALAGVSAGLWSAIVFATTALVVFGGHMVRMDMLLTATAAFAWLAAHRFFESGMPRALVSFWALSAVALATKGPVALLFTVLPALAWFALARGAAGLRALRPIIGLGALAAAVAVWIGAVLAAGHQDYLVTIWRQQLVGRAINSWSHPEPFYFYVLVLPVLLLPWTGLVAHGAWQLWRERAAHRRELALFTLLPLVCLSVVSEKLVIYLLPMLPGVAIVGGLAAARLAPHGRVSAWLSVPPLLFGLLLAAALAWVSPRYLEDASGQGLALAAALTVATIGAALFLGGAGRRWLWSVVALSVAASWLVFGLALYLINPLLSARALATALVREAPADTPIATVDVTRGALNYYAARTFDEVGAADIGSWIAAHPDGVIVINRADLAKAFGESVPPCRGQETYRVALKEYRVLFGCGT
jgi:4-amino-4-deoxy-L-arabinose transferase-like glycosyltransferase